MGSVYEDDKKIIRAIEDESSVDSLRRHIDSITNWTKEWLMNLNSSFLHFGKKNY